MAEQKTETYPVHDKELLIHPTKSPNDVPVIHIDQNRVVIADPTGKSSIFVGRNLGTGIAGPFSLMASPYEIRMHGLWKINPLVMTTIPSSIYTPIPWLAKSVPKPPTEMIKGIVKISGLLAGLK